MAARSSRTLTPSDTPRRAGAARCGVWLLVGLALHATGCAKNDYTLAEARGWSSQRAWEVIEDQESVSINRIQAVFGVIPGDTIDNAAESSYAIEAQEKSQSLPPGGLKLLLDRARASFVPTVQSATAGLTEGASGIIVLGDFIGPDGRPLDHDRAAQVDVENFLDALQASDGVAGDWIILALSPHEMQRVLDDAEAEPNMAVKLGIHEFIYAPANIYYMELLVSASPEGPSYAITYAADVRLSQVQTRTKVPWRGSGEVTFFYQPFAEEWLPLDEETARREQDAREREATIGEAEKRNVDVDPGKPRPKRDLPLEPER